MLVLYQMHKIFSFHPSVAHLEGLDVTSPRKAPNQMYPGPHNELPDAHFQTSIFASLSAPAEPMDEDEDEDENYDDEPELLEIPANHDNEAVSIWAKALQVDPNGYPPAEWRLDNEERDKPSPGLSNLKNVENSLSDLRSFAVV